MLFVCQQKNYSQDYAEQDQIDLRFHLEHYKHDVSSYPNLQNVTSTSKFCQGPGEKMSVHSLSLVD